MDELTFQAEVDQARELYPDLVEEFERLRQWCAVCLGDDVAKIGGLKV